MRHNMKVQFKDAIIIIKAAQDVKEKEKVSFTTYGEIVKHDKKGSSPEIGTALTSTKAGKLCEVKLKEESLEGELWLNY